MVFVSQTEILKKHIFYHKLWKNKLGYQVLNVFGCRDIKDLSREYIIEYLKDLTKKLEDISETPDKEFFKNMGFSYIVEEEMFISFLQVYEIKEDPTSISSISFSDGKYNINFKDDREIISGSL
jgi:hypothetical protein